MADSQVEPVAMTGVVNTDNSQIRPPSTPSEQLKRRRERKPRKRRRERKRKRTDNRT
ncbi:Hypothetical predicted protein [Olea europaea subsp. europaea]|uniref:Uncharacterized protein n=1 Tax=Olea europaea subsp. europaea TaxID=158383 RepID=A0A8S0UWI7_OLEEU|nr:Hypothetical predicted protein [Olea europaea subsp. europaea]